MREIISLNENWTLSFPKGDHVTEQVNLPHTWNAVDGNDGNGSYLRTTGVYTRTFEQPKQPREGGRTYVEVLAAALNATVKVNGTVATTHEGGFSIFRADVTDLCHEGENELTIEVSNEDTPSMYPASADFTFYGGLYRGVNLISVPNAHFDLDYYGGPGIMVTPVPTEDGGANFTIKSFVTNPADDLTVLYSIEDCFGREVASAVRGSAETEVTIYVPDAQLWSMDEPNLYTVTATLQRNNEAVDEIYANVGVRSFKVTPNEGFSINGVPTPLRGVSRHQDRVFEGNALTAEEHYDDAMLIKELGANTIRLAHYQHSQDFYDACDEIGFAVWAEIPFISVFKKGEGAHTHVMEEMKELIIQNYNHPSIMFWGISNEILIGGISQELVDTHHDLEKLCKELDPTRLTTIAHVSHTPWTAPCTTSPTWRATTTTSAGTAARWSRTAPGWTSSTPTTPTSASAFPSTAARASSTGTATRRSARTTPRSIRHCTTSTWHRSSRTVPGCGLPTSGTCSTSAALHVTRAA